MTAMDTAPLSHEALRATLRDGGLPAPAIDDWISAEPAEPATFSEDRRRYSMFWAHAGVLLAAPAKEAGAKGRRGEGRGRHPRTRAVLPRALSWRAWGSGLRGAHP